MPTTIHELPVQCLRHLARIVSTTSGRQEGHLLHWQLRCMDRALCATLRDAYHTQWVRSTQKILNSVAKMAEMEIFFAELQRRAEHPVVYAVSRAGLEELGRWSLPTWDLN